MGETRKRKEKKKRGVRLSFSGRYPLQTPSSIPPLDGDLLARRRGLQKKKMREEKER